VADHLVPESRFQLSAERQRIQDRVLTVQLEQKRCHAEPQIEIDEKHGFGAQSGGGRSAVDRCGCRAASRSGRQESMNVRELLSGFRFAAQFAAGALQSLVHLHRRNGNGDHFPNTELHQLDQALGAVARLNRHHGREGIVLIEFRSDPCSPDGI
jgi:hypothetical protein